MRILNWRAGRVGVLQTLLLVSAAAQDQRPALPPPDVANVAYGPHERNVLDLWKARSNVPSPLVIFIHVGGFSKGGLRPLLSRCCCRSVSGAVFRWLR